MSKAIQIKEVATSLGNLNISESENYAESPNSFYSDRSDEANFLRYNRGKQQVRRTSIHPNDRHFTNSKDQISVAPEIFNPRIVQKQVDKLNEEIKILTLKIESVTERRSSDESEKSNDSGNNLDKNSELQVEEWREEMKVLLYMRSKLECHLYI